MLYCLLHVPAEHIPIRGRKSGKIATVPHGLSINKIHYWQFMKRDREILSKYLPSAAVERIMKWLKEYKVQLSITRSRNTKLGDYRSPINGGAHRISINHDLNQYAFLITLVHEIAHLLVWEKYKTKALPHGKEWKGSFKELMKPFIQEGIFPEELKIPLMDYLQNAKASS